jgi:hypothetical protein
MANPIWPVELPQIPIATDYGEKPEDQVARTKPDEGPLKKRRRTTIRIVEIPCSMEITSAQWETLLVFYYDTLGECMPFDWLHPRTGNLSTFGFKGPPELSVVAADHYKTNFTLEQIV